MQAEVHVRYHSAATVWQMFPAMHDCNKLGGVCLGKVSQALKIHQPSDLCSPGHGTATWPPCSDVCQVMPSEAFQVARLASVELISEAGWPPSVLPTAIRSGRAPGRVVSAVCKGWLGFAPGSAVAEAQLQGRARAAFTAWLYLSSHCCCMLLSHTHIAVVHRTRLACSTLGSLLCCSLVGNAD